MIIANVTATGIWVQRILLALLTIIVLLAPLLDDRVDVEIYKNVEDGEMTYCETGTLVDPPYQYMGSGKIRKAKAEGC